ncbi:MAG: hypothetical protein WBG92_16160 [Thiohalocapsa sp.]
MSGLLSMGTVVALVGVGDAVFSILGGLVVVGAGLVILAAGLRHPD